MERIRLKNSDSYYQKEMMRMICVPAEIEIDNESIILQMQKVREAAWKLDEEMSKLRKMIDTTAVREKGIRQESLPFN